MAMAATLTHPPSDYSENRLARIVTDRAVEEQLTPMLASAMTTGAADLVRRSWAVVGPLVDLTDREQEFHAAVGIREVLERLHQQISGPLLESLAARALDFWGNRLEAIVKKKKNPRSAAHVLRFSHAGAVA